MKVINTLDDIGPVFCEALAAQTIFMGFGIPAEDVYINYSPPKLQALARQGDLSFVIDVAEIDMPIDVYKSVWLQTVEAWNAAPIPERVALTERTQMRIHAVEILSNMLAKGMKSRSMQESGS